MIVNDIFVVKFLLYTDNNAFEKIQNGYHF